MTTSNDRRFTVQGTTNGAGVDEFHVIDNSNHSAVNSSPLSEVEATRLCEAFNDRQTIGRFVETVRQSAIYDSFKPSGDDFLDRLRIAASEANKLGPFYAAMGLSGEAGEICNKLKKVWRGDKPLDDALKTDLLDELGDVLWYVQEMASRLGSDIIEVMELNTAKIRDRMARGVIRGDGDKR